MTTIGRVLSEQTDAQRYVEELRERLKHVPKDNMRHGDEKFLLAQLDASNQTIADNEREASYWRDRAINAESQWGEKDAEIERLREELSRIEYLSRYYDAKLMCNGKRLDSIAADFGQIARDALNEEVRA